MEQQEAELMTIARELDKSASFILLKRQYYKNHRRIKSSILRFQEVVMVDRRDKHFLEFIIGVFPQKIKTLRTGFRLKYFSKEAVYLIWSILPYLERQKKLAELILEYSKLKSESGHKITPEEQAKRLSLYKQLQAERVRIKEEDRKARKKKK